MMTPRIQSAIKIFERREVRSFLWVFILKGGMIACNFTMIFLAARLLDYKSFGIYSIIFSAAGLCCVSATFGQQLLLMRAYREYSNDRMAGLLKGAFIFSAAITFAGALTVAIGFFLWLGLTQTGLLVLSAVVFVFLQTIVLVTSHLLRSAVSVGIGDGNANITATFPTIAYLVVCFIGGLEATVGLVFLFYALGLAIALVIHTSALLTVIPLKFPAGTIAEYETSVWRTRSIKLWLTSTMEASNQYLDVLIIGLLLNPQSAGAYFVITRLANVFATAADAINMFSTRVIPELFFEKRTAELNSVLDSVAAMIAVILIAGIVAISGLGSWVLEAFNPQYGQYFVALVILSLGTATLAAAGPAGSALMLTGHEGRYLSIIATAIAIRAICFIVLIPNFGILGAVFGTSFAFLFTAVALSRSTIERIGIDCSVLRLARINWRFA